MANIISKEAYEQSVDKPPRNGVDLSRGTSALNTSLGVVAMYADRALRLYRIQSGSESFLLDAPSSREEMAWQMALDHRKKSSEKGEGREELLAQALGEELEEGPDGKVGKKRIFDFNLLRAKGKMGVSDDGTAVHTDDSRPRRKEEISRAAFLLAKLDRYSQENLMQELRNNLKAMQDLLQHLQNLEHFLEQFKKLEDKGNISDLIAFLRKHYAGDPDMLKRVNELANKAEAAAEAGEDLKNENWFIRGAEEFFHTGRAQHDNDIINDFYHSLHSLCAEITSRALKDHPQLSEAMGQGQKLFLQQIHTLIMQVSEIMILLDTIQGADDGEKILFKTEAILLGVMTLATNNNAARQEQQATMSDLNVHIQDKLDAKAEETLDRMRKEEEDSHGIIGFFEHLFKFQAEVIIHIFTANLQGLSEDFTQSDFVTDVKNVAEFCYNLVVAVSLAAASALTCGQVKQCNKAFLDFGEKVISSPALHLISDTVMLVVIVASFMSGQVWLAVVMTALLVMNDVTDSSGNTLMADLTNSIAKGVQQLVGACGGQLSDDAAKAIADAIVVVVITAITFGAGSPAAVAEDSTAVVENAASTVAENSAAAAEDGVAAVGEEGLTQGADQEGALGRVKEALRKVKETATRVGKKVGYRNGLVMTISGMLINATNLPADMAKAVAKDNAHLREILSTLFAAIATLMMIVGGVALATTAESAQTRLGALLRKLAPRRLIDLCDANGATIAAKMLQTITASMIAGASVDIVKGVHQILFGILQKKAKELQGELDLTSAANGIVAQMGNSNSSDLKHATEEHDRFVRNMGAPADPSLGIAHALQGAV